MANVSSLWVGKPLSRAHRLALSSFIYHGHSVKLYVYDMDLEVPPGVKKLDANLIIPESEIFYHYGSVAPFADYFRYAMIAKTGEMWVDADTICLSRYFFEDKDYVFIEEKPGFYAQGILKMPPKSSLSNVLNQMASILVSRRKDGDGILGEAGWTMEDAESWIALGPGLLTKIVERLSLQEYGQPALSVNGVDLSVSYEDPYQMLWNPKNSDLMLRRFKKSICATFFNANLEFRELGHAKNDFPEGSVMRILEKKFLGI